MRTGLAGQRPGGAHAAREPGLRAHSLRRRGAPRPLRAPPHPAKRLTVTGQPASVREPTISAVHSQFRTRETRQLIEARPIITAAICSLAPTSAYYGL